MSQWNPKATSKWQTSADLPGVYVLPREAVTQASDRLSTEAKTRVTTFGDKLKAKMDNVAVVKRVAVTRSK